ncbi:MAG: Alpha N-terminal protein methyltransferase 1 [Thelocarpon impressellum]|nr:MAG: Alpha N-terminal protein methyltransferase 1 [Thelocarpon impressellum]
MADSPSDPDSKIDHAAALDYWSTVSADVNGMLGGYPQISRVDLQGSANFLAKLRRQSSFSAARTALVRGVDCGAGIGRVTLGFLAKVCDVVDMVEPVDKFVHELREGGGLTTLRGAGKIGDVVMAGLEDWRPNPGVYDLMWNQWCLGHLTDAQLVAYLQRSAAALRKGGWVVVKENLSNTPDGSDIFDELDNSVTRADDKFRKLFQGAGLDVVRTELQSGFPKGLGLYPVRQYALQPASR